MKRTNTSTSSISSRTTKAELMARIEALETANLELNALVDALYQERDAAEALAQDLQQQLDNVSLESRLVRAEGPVAGVDAEPFSAAPGEGLGDMLTRALAEPAPAPAQARKFTCLEQALAVQTGFTVWVRRKDQTLMVGKQPASGEQIARAKAALA